MRKALFIGCGLAALLSVSPQPTWAQSDYPSRPVHLVVGFGAGSAADLTARVLGKQLAETLGQPFLVEIKPGAGSTLAAEQVAHAPKDGYTLFIGTVAVIINGLLQQHPRVDLARDFAPVALATSSANILVVNPSTGVTSVEGLIALAKSKPGQLNFGTSGFGTSPHLTGELFNLMAQTKIVSVHYQGSAQALTDLLSGRVQVMFSPASTVAAHIKAGEIRALATSEITRSPSDPNLPTVAESGLPGFDTSVWFGVVAPAGTPRPIIDKLADAINKALKNPAAIKPLIAVGLDVKGGTPDQFAAYIASETKKYTKVVAEGNLKK